MAKLYFKVGSDWEEVVRLRNEIAKLKQELKGMDSTQSPAAFKALNTQLSASTQKMDELVTNAAKAGAVMEGDFKKKIFDASQTVNGFTEKIIAQKAVVKGIEADVKRLGEAYRTALKRNPLSANGKLNEYNFARQALDEEKAALFGLTQQQAEARLSVKKLRDEYALYQNDGKQVVETNNGIAISWKKALGIIGGTAVIKKFISDLVNIRGEFQKTQMSFETMLGSKEKADVLMAQMVQTAAKTPFDLQGVANGAKQLLAYGTAAEDVNDTLIRLGNIASGLSIPLGDMVYLYGTTQTQGRLFTQDVRQFMGRGIPLVKELAAMLGKTEEEINNMVTAGQIGFPEIEKVIRKMTDEGGKFYNLMEKQSQTLSGQISNLGDAWDGMLNSIGEDTQELTSKTISMATSVIENYESVGKILVGLITTYGAYRTAVMLVTAAESKHTLVEIGLTNARILARKAQLALNAAMLTNPYVLLATAVVGLGIAMWTLADNTSAAEKAQRRLNNEQDKAIKKESERKNQVESLIRVIQDETETELAKITAYERLQKLSPAITSAYSLEKLAILDLADAQKILNKERDTTTYDTYLRNIEESSNRLKQLKRDNGKLLGISPSTGIPLTINNDKAIEEEFKYLQQQKKALDEFSNRIMKTGEPSEKSTIYQEDLAKAKTDWLSAKKGYETLLKDQKATSKAVKEARDKMNDKEKAYKDLGGDTNISKQESTAEKLHQQLEKSNDQIIKNDLSLNAERLAIMEDGRKKRLSQSEQEWKERKVSLKKEYDDLIADNKKNGIITPQKVTDTYNARLAENDNAKAKRDADIYKEADKEFAEHQKELTAILLTEEDKRQQGIKERYDKEREWAKKQLDGNNMTDDEYKKYTILIDNAESQEMLKGLLDEYQDYTDKRLAIEKKFNDDIAALDKQREIAVEYGDTQTVEKIDRAKVQAVKDKNEAISAIDFEQFQKDIDWTILFDNLNKQSTTALKELRTKIHDYIKSAGDKLSPTDLKTLMDASTNLDTTIADRKPLDELVSGYKEYKEAVDAVRKAKEALEKTDNPEAEAKATKALSDAERKRAQSLTKMTTSVNNIGMKGQQVVQAGNDLCDMLTNYGVEIPKLISETLDGIGQVVDSLASIDFTNPVSIIKGAIGGLAGVSKVLGSLLGGKKHVISEETFAEYDRLIDAIDELINKQNELVKNSDTMSAEIAANEAKALAERKKLAAQNLNLDYLNSYDGSKHTVGYNLAKDLSGYRDTIKNAGIDWDALYGTGRMEGLANLDADHIKLFQGLPEVWAKLPERIRDYLNDVVEAAESADEATEGVKENLTGVSFDGFKNSFLDTLKDLDSSSRDFADNLEDYIRDAMLQSLVDNQFNNELKALYEKFASYRSKDSDGGNKITEAELEDLRKEQQELAERILDERKAMADIFGWKSESTSQSSTSKGYQTMSQDTGEELSGRFTALQIAGEEIKNQNAIQSQSLNLLTMKADDLLHVNTDMRNIADDTRNLIADSYLELVQISENTGNSAKYLKEIKADIAEVKKNTSKL